jgi:membrane protein YdbS with pleckstrin-like domain
VGVNQPDDIADGLDHQLDPRVIPLQRIAGGLFSAGVAVISLVAILISLVAEDGPLGWMHGLRLVIWLAAVLLLAWHAYSWPVRAYQHTWYRVDELGIEIRKGVFWRVVINVPKSRVQHIDVSQGPIDRRFELGTLVIYTAGTDHAKVELQGLEHDLALRVREHLLPPKEGIGAGDAV